MDLFVESDLDDSQKNVEKKRLHFGQKNKKNNSFFRIVDEKKPMKYKPSEKLIMDQTNKQ